MNSHEYWQKRAEQRILDAEKQSLRYENQIKEYFKQAEKDIESKISSLYMKYAKDNKMSYAESLKYLRNNQLKEFKRDLNFYIKSARDSNFRKEYRDYLQALSTRARVKCFEEFKVHLHSIAEKAFNNAYDGVFELYDDLLSDTYYKSIFDMQQFDGFGKSFKSLPQSTLQSLLQYPWSGSNFSEKLWGNIDNFEKKLDQTLTQGMIQGKSNRDIARDLVEATGQARQKAIRLVRTETNYICNQSTKIAYVNYGVQEYEYLATLDLKTSSMCRNLDGKHWPIDKAVPGENYPPLHAYCRSTTIPYFADDEGTRIARDEEIGKSYKVPANMTYNQWHKERVEANPEAVLAERKLTNLNTDEKQYEDYKNILRSDAPKSLDDFQNLKYNNGEYFDYVKLDYSRRNKLINNPELALPNADKTIVPEQKFTKYLFGGNDPRGLAKGKAFNSRLGYSIDNWDQLQKEISDRAILYPTSYKQNNGFGDLFEQKIIIYGLKNKPANVIVGWIKKDDDIISMTSTYIKEVK